MKLAVIHTIQLVVNTTLLSLHCAISVDKQPHQNQNPSYPTAVRPCSLALAALPVTQVSVERLFSAMRLLLSDLRSRLKQDAVEAMLLLRTNMI